MKSKGKVYLCINGKKYAFFSFWQELSDGSLYIGIGKTKKKFISLHSTGRVNYRGFSTLPAVPLTRYIEPLYRVTQPNLFLIITITTLENLGSADNEVDEESLLFEVPERTIPLAFHFMISPASYVPQTSGFYIRFKEMMSLVVACDRPDDVDKTFPKTRFLIHPGIGKQLIDKHVAFIDFHQKLNNTTDGILYSRNAEGDYKLVFSAPMRRPPNTEILLENPTYTAQIVQSTNSMVRFKIKDKHNQTVKEDVLITGWRLDAEL